jgi:hypothetical protein
MVAIRSYRGKILHMMPLEEKSLDQFGIHGRASSRQQSQSQNGVMGGRRAEDYMPLRHVDPSGATRTKK